MDDAPRMDLAQVTQLRGSNSVDFRVNVANDVLFALDAFTGAPYPFSQGDPCGFGL